MHCKIYSIIYFLVAISIFFAEVIAYVRNQIQIPCATFITLHELYSPSGFYFSHLYCISLLAIGDAAVTTSI